MCKTSKVKVLSVIDQEWTYISEQNSVIRDYLVGKSNNREIISSALYISLRLVASELTLYKNSYILFPQKEYSEEDFIDLIIENIGNKLPSIDDKEGNNSYINNMRKIVWGYIKCHVKEIILLLKKTTIENYKVDSEDIHLMKDCLVVVFVESLMRNRELQLLEHDFHD